MPVVGLGGSLAFGIWVNSDGGSIPLKLVRPWPSDPPRTYVYYKISVNKIRPFLAWHSDGGEEVVCAWILLIPSISEFLSRWSTRPMVDLGYCEYLTAFVL
jgi:hypothetical protein